MLYCHMRQTPQNPWEAYPWQAYEVAQFQFIVTELDLALTFLNIAESAEDNDKAARNMEHAWRAYGAATKFLENAKLTAEMSHAIEEKLGRLHAHL
jgi:hypothetical protein